MASVIAGGLFNAIAFAGAGFFFSKLNPCSYKALEELGKGKEMWEENEIKQKDRIQLLKEQLRDANTDINQTNMALDKLRKIQTIKYDGMRFNREPQLLDHYKPSKEMQEYQMVFIGGVSIASS